MTTTTQALTSTTQTPSGSFVNTYSGLSVASDAALFRIYTFSNLKLDLEYMFNASLADSSIKPIGPIILEAFNINPPPYLDPSSIITLSNLRQIVDALEMDIYFELAGLEAAGVYGSTVTNAQITSYLISNNALPLNPPGTLAFAVTPNNVNYFKYTGFTYSTTYLSFTWNLLNPFAANTALGLTLGTPPTTQVPGSTTSTTTGPSTTASPTTTTAAPTTTTAAPTTTTAAPTTTIAPSSTTVAPTNPSFSTQPTQATPALTSITLTYTCINTNIITATYVRSNTGNAPANITGVNTSGLSLTGLIEGTSYDIVFNLNNGSGVFVEVTRTFSTVGFSVQPVVINKTYTNITLEYALSSTSTLSTIIVTPTDTNNTYTPSITKTSTNAIISNLLPSAEYTITYLFNTSLTSSVTTLVSTNMFTLLSSGSYNGFNYVVINSLRDTITSNEITSLDAGTLTIETVSSVSPYVAPSSTSGNIFTYSAIAATNSDVAPRGYLIAARYTLGGVSFTYSDQTKYPGTRNDSSFSPIPLPDFTSGPTYTSGPTSIVVTYACNNSTTAVTVIIKDSAGATLSPPPTQSPSTAPSPSGVVTFSGLVSATQYKLQVIITDGSNTNSSTLTNVTTPSASTPAFTNSPTNLPTDKSINLTYTVNANTDVLTVEYIKTSDIGQSGATNTAVPDSTLTGLSVDYLDESTSYTFYFRFKKNPSGPNAEVINTVPLSFSTLGFTTIPYTEDVGYNTFSIIYQYASPTTAVLVGFQGVPNDAPDPIVGEEEPYGLFKKRTVTNLLPGARYELEYTLNNGTSTTYTSELMLEVNMTTITIHATETVNATTIVYTVVAKSGGITINPFPSFLFLELPATYEAHPMIGPMNANMYTDEVGDGTDWGDTVEPTIAGNIFTYSRLPFDGSDTELRQGDIAAYVKDTDISNPNHIYFLRAPFGVTPTYQFSFYPLAAITTAITFLSSTSESISFTYAVASFVTAGQITFHYGLTGSLAPFQSQYVTKTTTSATLTSLTVNTNYTGLLGWAIISDTPTVITGTFSTQAEPTVTADTITINYAVAADVLTTDIRFYSRPNTSSTTWTLITSETHTLTSVTFNNLQSGTDYTGLLGWTIKNGTKEVLPGTLITAAAATTIAPVAWSLATTTISVAQGSAFNFKVLNVASQPSYTINQPGFSTPNYSFVGFDTGFLPSAGTFHFNAGSSDATIVVTYSGTNRTVYVTIIQQTTDAGTTDAGTTDAGTTDVPTTNIQTTGLGTAATSDDSANPATYAPAYSSITNRRHYKTQKTLSIPIASAYIYDDTLFDSTVGGFGIYTILNMSLSVDYVYNQLAATKNLASLTGPLSFTLSELPSRQVLERNLISDINRTVASLGSNPTITDIFTELQTLLNPTLGITSVSASTVIPLINSYYLPLINAATYVKNDVLFRVDTPIYYVKTFPSSVFPAAETTYLPTDLSGSRFPVILLDTLPSLNTSYVALPMNISSILLIQLADGVDQYIIVERKLNISNEIVLEIGGVEKRPGDYFSFFTHNYRFVMVGSFPLILRVITPCLVRGALILTPRGYKKIETLTEGNLIITHRGKPSAILKISRQLIKWTNTLPSDKIVFRINGKTPIYISAWHKIRQQDGRMVEARFCNLPVANPSEYCDSNGMFEFYHINIANWSENHLIVSDGSQVGVIVESWSGKY